MLTIREPIIEQTGHENRISWRIDTDSHQFEIKFSVPADIKVDPSDALLASALFPAMRLGQDCSSSLAVSGKLLTSMEKIQDILYSWYPDFVHIRADAPIRRDAIASTERGVGCFFSGGVDSFYSLLKHRDEITHLIFVHGFDMSLNDSQLRKSVSKQLNDAAKRLNLPLIEVETNLRDFSDKFVSWGEQYHGAALATVAHLLSPAFSKVIIPASFSYRYLNPWGSHPLLDPLWSSERLQLVHDGCEATRIAKIASISQHEVARETLRVCYENRESSYNCCCCTKCLNTMLALDVIGELGNFVTFPGKLSRKLLQDTPIATAPGNHFSGEIIEYLASRGEIGKYDQEIRSRMIAFECRQKSGDVDPAILATVRSTLWFLIRDEFLHAVWATHQRSWLFNGIARESLRYLCQKFKRIVRNSC